MRFAEIIESVDVSRLASPKIKHMAKSERRKSNQKFKKFKSVKKKKSLDSSKS